MLNINRFLAYAAFPFLLLRRGYHPKTLLFGGLSLGDDLLCTAVLREARNRGSPFAMMTARPEIFSGNEDASAILPLDDFFAAGLRRLGGRVIKPYYAGGNPKEPNRDILPRHHIIVEMCRLAGITGEIQVRPYLNLLPKENLIHASRRKRIVIHTSTRSAKSPFETKDWVQAAWRPLSTALKRHAEVIQIGAHSDPACEADEDRRGKTSIREAASLISSADVFIGLEGFLSHLARAVDCPAVVILGGRATAESVGYPCNENIGAAPACAPCGLRQGCPHDVECMKMIKPETVLAAALRILESPPERPLRSHRVKLPEL